MQVDTWLVQAAGAQAELASKAAAQLAKVLGLCAVSCGRTLMSPGPVCVRVWVGPREH